ncbi:hypothetical protein HYW99_00150 [Candidatus Woesearchaeota archaeon]|nr:hypothetical protein [Candidatus Woesearchaeota archaeon]
MRQLNQFLDLEELNFDFEFEDKILELNDREADLLIKKGYKIKKPIWNGLVAS